VEIAQLLTSVFAAKDPDTPASVVVDLQDSGPQYLTTCPRSLLERFDLIFTQYEHKIFWE